MTQFVTIPMLRDHIGDRLSDVQLGGKPDLTWDDAELFSCMEAAARSYNSLPPCDVGRITDASRLDATSDMFLDAAAANALERRVRSLSVNRVAFQAGGIETDPDGIVIDGMLKLARMLREKFTAEARAHKGTINMRACWGRVG